MTSLAAEMESVKKVSPSAKGGKQGIFRNNGLTIVTVALFLLAWLGQTITGWKVCNENRQEHGLPEVALPAYVLSGDFLEASAENWESEFLQMAAFVWFTSFLFQRGSPESNDPAEEPDDQTPVTSESPWPARRGGWVLKIYENSLALAFLILFFICVALHAIGGASKQSLDQIAHNKPPLNAFQYILTAQFWFESLQNWQSEFLSIAAMVVFSIFLRQKDSPESKAVATPHWQQE